MEIFISWSGEKSKALAETLKGWFPAVIQAVKPYYTPDDIAKGARWNTGISQELEASRIGILCLTSENLNAPWIMFEAGALSKNLDKSKVCPILFGLDPSEIVGPLVQFQYTSYEKTDFLKLIKMINAELGENSISSNILEDAFEMWWPHLKDKVDKILQESISIEKPSTRSDRELIEEILSLSRTRLRIPSFRMNQAVITDLGEGYISLCKEMGNSLKLVGEEPAIEHALRFLRKPITYLVIRFSDSPELKEKFEKRISSPTIEETIEEIENETPI